MAACDTDGESRVPLPPLLGFQGGTSSGHRLLRRVVTPQIEGPRILHSSGSSRNKPRPLPQLTVQTANGAPAPQDDNGGSPNSERPVQVARKSLSLNLPEGPPPAGSPPPSRQLDRGQLSSRGAGRMPPLSAGESRTATPSSGYGAWAGPPTPTPGVAWSPTKPPAASGLGMQQDHGGAPGTPQGGMRGASNVYNWEPDTQRVLTESTLKETDVASFMKSMAQVVPDSSSQAHSADPHALHWFRSNHPDATPTQRQDAVIARVWLEEQMLELKRAVGRDRQRSDEASGGGGGIGGAVIGRAASPGAGATRAMSPGANPGCCLSDDGQDSLLMVREPEGFLNSTVMRHQEALLSKCMDELCGQVATACIERGHLMFQLWQSMKQIIKLLLQDRELARLWMRDARASEAAAVEAAKGVKTKLEAEKNELLDINEILNRRLMNQKAEHEICKIRVRELERVVEKVTTSQPEVLQRSIDELRAALSASERQNLVSQQRADKALGHIGEQESELTTMSIKLEELQSNMEELSEQGQVRTPRPEQQQQPPWELLAAPEVALAQLALRQGCSPTDMHRLMLGVSATGANLLPWFSLAGSCRALSMNGLDDPLLAAALVAGEAAAAAEALQAGMPQVGGRNPPLGGKRDGDKKSGLPAGVRNSMAQFSSGTLQRGADVSGAPGGKGAGMPRASMMARGGADGLPQASGGRRGNKSAALVHLNSMHDMFHWLKELLVRQHVPTMSKCLPEPVLEAIGQMMNHGVDVDSITSMLLGTLGPEGTDIAPYKTLGGVLATKFAHTKTDIGGPITEALKVAAMSTAARMRHLETHNKAMHRETVKLRRALGEQRKQETNRTHQEARAEQRKVTVHRVPVALDAFLMSRRSEMFVGMGSEDLPMVLHCDGKVFNRCMEKGDAERLLNSVWQGKRDFERSTQTRIALADYLYIFLHKKYGTPKALTEAAYNLIYTLGQHTYDPDCNLFLKIFLGEVEESEFEDQHHLKREVLNALNKADLENNSKITGWLLKIDIRNCLKLVFKDKAQPMMDDVFDALDSDEPHEMVAYHRLFDEDEDLNQGVFAETIRSQHLNERLEFLQTLEDTILDAADRAGVDSLSCPIMLTTLKRSHLHLSDAQLTEFMKRVFGSTWAPASRKLPSVPLEASMRLMRREQASTLISLTAAIELASKAGKAGNHKAADDAKVAKKGIVWAENTVSAFSEQDDGLSRQASSNGTSLQHSNAGKSDDEGGDGDEGGGLSDAELEA